MRYSKYNFWILWTFLLLGIIFFSCTPQSRLNRLLSNHPELIKHDTVFKKDTIIVNSSSVDTVFKNQITKDTIVIRENNLTVKYFNNGEKIYRQIYAQY